MRISLRAFSIIVLAVFWGVIGISMATGSWQTKETAEEIVVESPADIKGWMTLENISEYFDVSVAELIKIFGLPADTDKGEKIKELAEEQGKETEDFRMSLAEYLEVPKTGAAPAKTEPQPGSQAAASKNHTPGSGTEVPQGDGSGQGGLIKGRMTLKEVEVATKVPAAYICEKIGIPGDTATDVPLRDLAGQYGFEVDAIRDMVDSYQK